MSCATISEIETSCRFKAKQMATELEAKSQAFRRAVDFGFERHILNSVADFFSQVGVVRARLEAEKCKQTVDAAPRKFKTGLQTRDPSDTHLDP